MTFVLTSVQTDPAASREGAQRILARLPRPTCLVSRGFVATVQGRQPAASDAMTSCIMLSSPWAALSIPSMPFGLVWSMLHAPGLVGVAAADIAEIAAASAKMKTSIIVAISFLFISLLLWLGALFGRRGDGNEVRLRARGQDVDDVEVDSVRTRDRAVDVAEAAVDEALARVVRRL